MTIELKVPDVGESVTEVYIGEWLKQEGDEVSEDENIVELESEKATFEAPAPASGVLAKILKKPGETAEVGDVIAEIEPSAEAGKPKHEEKPKAEKKTEKKREKPKPKREPRQKEAAKAEKEQPEPKAKEAEAVEAEPRIMPAAWRALQEHGLSPEQVDATGPGGRLLKEDVLRYVESREAPEEKKEEVAPEEAKRPPARRPVPRPEAEGDRQEETVPMSPIRRRIAERLVEAQRTAALLTTFNEIDMSAVQALRRSYRDAFQDKYGIKLGIMSFFVKAVVDALAEFPQVNAEIRDDQIVYRNYYDIGIAIGGGKGLIVPVLRNAERMSFAEIEQAIDDFARRARQNKIGPEELRGGTFTISNGGIYGSLLSTPIVNPPQSGVLGMHAIQDRPVVRDGQVLVRPMMYVALTYDHRLVDGREAVTFLRRIKEVVEEPSRLLLEV